MRLAYLFPGQGAQAVGMGRELARTYPAARAVFERADEVLGLAFSRLCWEGPEDELRQTVNAQPALLVHSIAALRVLESSRPDLAPSWTAGHSLGEYSACVAAGALAFEDALSLVRRRGELMQQAGQKRPGTMAAVLGVDRMTAQLICDEAAKSDVVVPANLNAPGQVVISGDRAAVERAAGFAERHGAKRFIMLQVSGAFHSSLMESAAEKLAQALKDTPFHEPRCPVVSNVGAEQASEPDKIRLHLERQLLEPVEWEKSMQFLLDQKLDGYVELGTGSVLRGLLRSIDRKAAASAWSIGDPETLKTALGDLQVMRMPAGNA